MWNIRNMIAALGLTVSFQAGPVYVGKRRPTGAALRNPADPVQAARQAKAFIRREARAEKLARNTLESVSNNWAHGCGDRRVHACPLPNHTGSLNPFYIAK